MEDMVSKKLGPYRLISRLARGGMSEVYLVSDERNEQIYALKLVRWADEEECLRFQHEIKMLMLLKHPHILSILDYGEQEDICYYVMPYIACGTLKNRITRGPLSQKEAEAVLIQIADALEFLHQAGFVHRDVKPSNVLQDEKNHVWLADFGLVVDIERGSDLTSTGCLMGTPAYMAPELEHAQASVSSDIYALGVVLYEMLTGRLPFNGKTPIALYLKQVSEPPPFPSTLNPLISPAIEQVVLCALAKEPADRYTSVQALAEAYQQALLTETVASSARLRPASCGNITITIKPVKKIRRQKRRLALGALTTILLFTVSGVSMSIAFHSGMSPSPVSAAQSIALPPVEVHPTPTPTLPVRTTGGKTPVPAPTPVNTSGNDPRKPHGKPHKPNKTHE